MKTQNALADDHDHRCPNCGACKTCGAGGRQPIMPMLYPVYPWPYAITYGTGTTISPTSQISGTMQVQSATGGNFYQ